MFGRRNAAVPQGDGSVGYLDYWRYGDVTTVIVASRSQATFIH